MKEFVCYIDGRHQLSITVLLLGLLAAAVSQFNASGDQYPRDCIASATEGTEKATRSLRCKYLPRYLPSTVVYLTVKAESPSKLDTAHLLPLKHVEILVLQGLGIEIIEDTALATLPDLKILNLAHTKITSLTNLTFHQCVNLTELNLDFVKLKHIQLGTFAHLRSLERLYLSNADLYELPNLFPSSLTDLILTSNFLRELPQVATSLEKLQKLDLCGNDFKRFSAHSFNTPILGYLCLGDLIEQMDADALRSLTDLHTLEIKTKEMTIYNILQNVSIIESLQKLNVYYAHAEEGEAPANITLRLPNLKQLQMIQVQGTVQPQLFLAMPNLQVLDLHGSPQLANAILNSDEALENLHNITTLGLQETDTDQLQERHLAKLVRLKKINLISNPIRCDCNLTWLVSRVLDLELVLEHHKQTVCNSPNHLYAQQITSDVVQEEICISGNYSRAAKAFDNDKDADGATTNNQQRTRDDDGVNLSHVLYAIIGLGILLLILIIVVIVTHCIPKWRNRHKRNTHSRLHRNSLDLLPHGHGDFDAFSAEHGVTSYEVSKTPPNPPVRCSSTTFKRRTSNDVAF